ncbi:protein GUCD1 [Octopus bimaculoides]|uniref:Uncharacterized protein n=1 Tax=Octopus bimaculoides TaxID=37653 RepID=A0A0L8H670_OCTBM|nr:protein GUCD1 [Octopus bimaculoides]|eukprot:XP_014775054.1 PREDICTED: protein GUCD1-like [Octopus bimaculoides]
MLECVQPVTASVNRRHYNIDNTNVTSSTPSVDDCLQKNGGERKVPARCKPDQRREENADSLSITIPFQSQKYSWDCGLACCSMVLRYLGKDDSSIYNRDLERLQCGQSVWTIHLAYLLKYHGVVMKFFTVTLGADKNYAEQKFYQNHFDSDEAKINQLFESAHRNGVSITKQNVDI